MGKADLIAALWGMSNEEIEKKEEMGSEMEEEEETIRELIAQMQGKTD